MSKSVKIFIGVVVLLVVVRLLLPIIVLKYVNNALKDMDGYTGHVDDIDIALIRGAYQINGMVIEKVNNKVKEPFVKLPKTDLSVQWKSLFKGKLVSEVTCFSPVINFAYGASEDMEQTGVEHDWTEVIRDLLPIEINQFMVNDGKVNLLNIVTQPAVNVSLDQIELSMTNIRNVDNKEDRLPSDVRMTGNFVGANAPLEFDAKMQLLKEIPDFDYNMSISNYPLKDLNEPIKYYTGMDFEEGTVTIVSELALQDKQMKGYLKPLTNNLKIFKFDEGDDRKLGAFFKELFAEAGSKLLTNFKKDQVAAVIPIVGNVDNVETKFWPILVSSLKNAYINAFKKEFETNTYFSQLYKPDGDFEISGKEKRQAKREERQEERDERKAERKKH